MTMPGFTAERSAYSYSRHGAVTPAIIKGGGNPWIQCLEDCHDTKCAGKTAKQCNTLCQNYCKSGIEAGPTQTDPTNHALCVGGCWAWWVACEINPFMFGCSFVRDQCIAGCP